MNLRQWLAPDRLRAARKSLQRVGLVLGAGLLVVQLWQSGVSLAGRPVAFRSPEALALAGAFAVVAIAVQMAAWGWLLRSLGVIVPGRAILRGYILSFLPRYIPGLVWGYLSRSEWLARDHQVSFGLSNLASLLEMGLILAAGLSLIGFQALAAVGGPAAWLAGGVLAGLAALTPLILAGLWRRWRPAAADGLPRLRWTHSLILMGLYLLFWLCHGAAIQSLAYALEPEAATSLLACAASFALAWWLGFIVILVPSGLGVREWALAAALAAFAGLPVASAGLVALLTRLVSVLSEGGWALVGAALTMRSAKSRPPDNP
ncbi:MAG: flippase-like domain-containing protein [Anaerolineales bacterium]|nr:flippase-like domain-containing protein [Anaerolineales bacterium]